MKKSMILFLSFALGQVVAGPNEDLWKAIIENDFIGVEQALKAHADPNVSNINGLSALFYAMKKASKEIFNILLTFGADVNKSIREESSLLSEAAFNGLDSHVEQLLSKGANIDYQNPFGATALIFAIQTNHDSVATILINKGANVGLLTTDKVSALEMALHKNNALMIKKLLLKNANPNITNKSGWTSLMLAVQAGHAKCVQELINNKKTIIDMRSENSHMVTALQLALSNKKEEFVEVLLRAGAKIPYKLSDNDTDLINKVWSKIFERMNLLENLRLRLDLRAENREPQLAEHILSEIIES